MAIAPPRKPLNTFQEVFSWAGVPKEQVYIIADQHKDPVKKKKSVIAAVGDTIGEAVSTVYSDVKEGVSVIHDDVKGIVTKGQDTAADLTGGAVDVVKGAEETVGNIAWPLAAAAVGLGAVVILGRR